jgi:hypothetical protein
MPLQINHSRSDLGEMFSGYSWPLTPTLEGNISVGISRQIVKMHASYYYPTFFVEKIVLKFGIPQTILTDQGSNFLSDLLTNICKLLQIKKIKTTAYHPQSNGALECTHRVLIEYLRCFILEDQTNWDKWISYATFVFNTTSHTATGFTPHERMFGRKPNIPGILQNEPPMCNTYMIITSRNYSHVYNPALN